jgi:hypothetical protein
MILSETPRSPVEAPRSKPVVFLSDMGVYFSLDNDNKLFVDSEYFQDIDGVVDTDTQQLHTKSSDGRITLEPSRRYFRSFISAENQSLSNTLPTVIPEPIPVEESSQLEQSGRVLSSSKSNANSIYVTFSSPIPLFRSF